MLRSGCWRLREWLYRSRGALRAPAKSGRRSLVSCIDRKTHLVRSPGGEGVPWSERPQSACHPRLALGGHVGHHPRAHLPRPAGRSPHSVHLAGFSDLPHSLRPPSVAPLGLVCYSSTPPPN